MDLSECSNSHTTSLIIFPVTAHYQVFYSSDNYRTMEQCLDLRLTPWNWASLYSPAILWLNSNTSQLHNFRMAQWGIVPYFHNKPCCNRPNPAVTQWNFSSVTTLKFSFWELMKPFIHKSTRRTLLVSRHLYCTKNEHKLKPYPPRTTCSFPVASSVE